MIVENLDIARVTLLRTDNGILLVYDSETHGEPISTTCYEGKDALDRALDDAYQLLREKDDDKEDTASQPQGA